MRTSKPANLRTVAVLLVGTVLLLSGCTWWKRFAYSGIGRDDWQQPARVIETLAVAPGARIADVGAGGGYFTWPLAEAAGPTGKVFAVDVDAGLLDYIERESAARGLTQVVRVDAEFADPKIPEPVDLIFMSNTYHHIQERESYFALSRRYLRPGGRVAIVELAGKDWFSSWFGHFTSVEQIRSELESAGYELVAQHDFLERQSFLIFRAR